jgi:hypothetical protein
MKKIKTAKVKVIFEFDYIDMVNQMIEDNQFDSKDDIEEYLREQIGEDILDDLTNNPDCGNITVTVQ